MTVFEKAESIVQGARQADYGPPERCHEQIAQLWSAYLRHPISPRDVCWMMVLLKAGRDSYQPKEDNLVDGAGYIRLIEMISTK